MWREIKLMERLSHPNVVKFIDAIDTPKQAILHTGHFVVARSRRKTQKIFKVFWDRFSLTAVDFRPYSPASGRGLARGSHATFGVIEGLLLFEAIYFIDSSS